MKHFFHNTGILAARISISNLQKQTLNSFSKTMKLEYDYLTPKTKQKANLISEEMWKIIESNAQQLDEAIDYRRDFDFDYFGKTGCLNCHISSKLLFSYFFFLH